MRALNEEKVFIDFLTGLRSDQSRLCWRPGPKIYISKLVSVCYILKKLYALILNKLLCIDLTGGRD